MDLHDAAERLGVHYMTAYRYVRLGRLPSTQRDGRWLIRRVDVEALRREMRSRRQPPAGAGRRRPGVLRDRLMRCLVAGDETGAWSVVERAISTGYTPPQIYLDLLAPSLRTVGERWSDGELTVGEEHTVSAVTARLVGRLGPRFIRRGRTHGTVVVGSAPGDPHSLPVAMFADVVRAHGYRVIDLGGNTPVRSYIDTAAGAERLIAVGVSVSDANCLGAAGAAVAAVRERLGVPVLVGGPATDEAVASKLGADGWAPDAEAAATELDRLRRRPS